MGDFADDIRVLEAVTRESFCGLAGSASGGEVLGAQVVGTIRARRLVVQAVPAVGKPLWRSRNAARRHDAVRPRPALPHGLGVSLRSRPYASPVCSSQFCSARAPVVVRDDSLPGRAAPDVAFRARPRCRFARAERDVLQAPSAARLRSWRGACACDPPGPESRSGGRTPKEMPETVGPENDRVLERRPLVARQCASGALAGSKPAGSLASSVHSPVLRARQIALLTYRRQLPSGATAKRRAFE